MKRYLIILVAGLTFNALQAQDVRDAVRYSQDNLNGTARFKAMSGAFGALGGDLSSLNVNPAGSSVFSNNQMGFTLSNFSTKNDSDYFRSKASEKINDFDLNQAGAVFVFKDIRRTTGWNKFALGINYENTNNFDNSVIAFGTNPTNSVGDYFLSFANANPSKNQVGIPLGVILDNNYHQLNYIDQQAWLGYKGFLINAVDENDDNNSVYTSNVPAGGNYYHKNTITSTGYNGKLSFNASAAYEDRIYLGLNLNTHFTDFRQNTLFLETNNNGANSNDIDLIDTSFENEIYTYGSGFSFQLGTIIKATKELRLGIAYESPTWYNLNDEVRQNLISTINDKSTPNTEIINPDSNYFIVYDTYQLKTPGKFTGSLAYVFGKKGLLSLDYSIKDYSTAEFSRERDSRDPYVNAEITTTLQNSSELRIGGEYKIQALSLRAGYRYEQSPYKNNRIIGDLNGYSAGIGYNFGSTKLDLSYANSKRNSQQGFFTQGFTDGARINTTTNSVSLSLLFEL
ncbi:outer membrane protein transport protein [Flavobacterium sp. NG2]|uniref:OmpP1/FadL family transporter n=1 Tax=Flavobacterium sp. NG2 TaxID=3097547 RepID=UPI002A831A92|nr:outer membrane protein transport protein [Flavobacterium sp. NG2]WPR71190.1 outer membrane protein transport protein [Flavobacterium sp. NG2]